MAFNLNTFEQITNTKNYINATKCLAIGHLAANASYANNLNELYARQRSKIQRFQIATNTCALTGSVRFYLATIFIAVDLLNLLSALQKKSLLAASIWRGACTR